MSLSNKVKHVVRTVQQAKLKANIGYKRGFFKSSTLPIAAHNLTPSMNRRGHCLVNAIAESFFHSLNTERVKRKVYATRSEAKADLFDYIEVFYN